MFDAFVTGFALSATLIIAIGAQNAHVLRQGLKREHVGLVVLICAGIDFVLIALGTAGVARAAAWHPALLPAVAWIGAAFLVAYGLAAARRALAPGRLALTDGVSRKTARQAVAQTLAVTLLNPHVYLDTVLLVGAVGVQQSSRLLFVGGAGLASAVWFVALGFGARGLTPLFARPAAWRVLEGLVALTMWGIAGSLVVA